MKISTKGRYAMRLLLDLAQHQQDGFVPLKEIAARQNISKNYLEQIVPLLNKAGMLSTNRGFQGGYKLAQPTGKVSVGEVLRATEGSLAPVACLEEKAPPCEIAADCMTLGVWQGLHDVIAEYLDGITLQDILDKHSAAAPFDYCI